MIIILTTLISSWIVICYKNLAVTVKTFKTFPTGFEWDRKNEMWFPVKVGHFEQKDFHLDQAPRFWFKRIHFRTRKLTNNPDGVNAMNV